MSTFDSIPPEGITNVDEWLACRLGKVTASRVWQVVKRTKTGWSAYRENYKMELIADRLTGMVRDTYKSEAMLWGQQTEPDAIARYNASAGVTVNTSTWFLPHPKLAWAGCSPDGLVGDDGMVQVKCPDSKTHVETLLGKEPDPDYVTQCQWELACSGRQWNDLLSYDPRVPSPIRLYRFRVHRDDVLIAQLEEMVRVFLDEIAIAIASLGTLAFEYAAQSPDRAVREAAIKLREVSGNALAAVVSNGP